jgi:hypothetical protein
VLEHQAKLAAERKTPEVAPSDPQLRIPLVGEVKRSDTGERPKRRRKDKMQPAQLKLGDF